MLDEFTYKEYEILLKTIITERKNLCFSDCYNPNLPQKFFILRHDVDFSLSAAMEMAIFEAERNIKATYFLPLSSQYFNLLSKEYRSIPRQFLELGHEVGLHYDVEAMNKCSYTDPNTQLRCEIDILSQLAGDFIKSISQHNPSVSGKDPFVDNQDFINAYDTQFTMSMGYYSDSCGAWRNSTYELFNSNKIPDRFQLLIHPFFWTKVSDSRWEKLDKWTNERCKSIEIQRKKVKQLWNCHNGVIQYEKRLSKA